MKIVIKVGTGVLTRENGTLDGSSIVHLVSALAGREHVMAAYAEAVRERYRFFSFGDSMVVI